MYAVIALFDNETEKFIKNLWRDLKEQSISFYGDEVEDRDPHITIASYDKLEIALFINQMDRFYEGHSSVKLMFQAIGTFMQTGTLFFSPTVSEEIFQFHRSHHEFFENFQSNPDSLYSPGNWIPHCTIANRLSVEKLSEAFLYCSQKCTEMKGFVREIAIVEPHYQDGKCVKAPIIYSKKLGPATY